MTGKRVTLLPLWNEIKPGRDSYVSDVQFVESSASARQVWRLNCRPVSFQNYGGGVVKRWSAFPGHCQTPEIFNAFMVECYEQNIVRPSSYAALFNKTFHTPRIPYTYNSLLEPGFSGGWQDALVYGEVSGPLRAYDMNSAYLWATSEGLPDPATFCYTATFKRDSLGAVYLVSRAVAANAKNLPFPFNDHGRQFCLASQEEMELYSLPPSCVLGGVEWTALTSGPEIVNHIRSLPAWENVRKSFWGRWASTGQLECQSRSTHNTWPIRNPALNLLWSHHIISRIKVRLWLHHLNAVHVFVDSIITRDELPASTDFGGWRLEKEYPNGLVIHGPGIYGEPGCELAKHAGTQTTWRV